VLNALAITAICLTGAMPFVLWFMPLEVTLGILLWIGLIITAQAFQEVPKAHALAVAIGFIPSLAAWGELLIETTLDKAAPGYSLRQAAAQFSPDLFFAGMLSLAQGFMLISILFSAIVAKVIDRKWRAAAVWCLVGAAASALGIIHAYVFTPDGGYAPALTWTGFSSTTPSGADFALAYTLAAILLFAMEALKPAEFEH
jgi:AGZA family xanthine/uracil permease-like MFS transporter